MPDELLKIAGRCDCEQVDGFYNRPSMIDPPYVYGFLSKIKGTLVLKQLDS